jgi:ArsR family transcriptional regulator, arsenate/arsenite/antimonite-responsive transcriptional repressor
MSKQRLPSTPDAGCVAGDPLTCAPLDDVAAAALARAFKALGHPVRLRLLSMIASSDEKLCVCDLTDSFRVSGPTISHHLKVLREAGLIDSERRGTWVYYRCRREALHELATQLSGAPAALPV